MQRRTRAGWRMLKEEKPDRSRRVGSLSLVEPGLLSPVLLDERSEMGFKGSREKKIYYYSHQEKINMAMAGTYHRDGNGAGAEGAAGRPGAPSSKLQPVKAAD